MKFKIRALNIKNRQEGLKECKKIGSLPYGCDIMIRKVFPLSIKIRDIRYPAANILKQEMLSRGGDVITSSDTLLAGSKGKTNVIIQGNIESIKSMVNKISGQPFGLKELSVELGNYIDRFASLEKGRQLKVDKKKFNLDEQTVIMGVLNVTPDSFYDGGYYFEKDKAFIRADAIVSEGADIIDVGGMSTRPGSLPVSPEEEIERIIPVIKYIKNNYKVLISADTCHSKVAERAIDAGAHIINDISGLSLDKKMAKIVSDRDVSVVIMHIKGTPENMQNNPVYKDVIDEIYDYFEERIPFAINSGIKQDKIILDPGIGFGKTLQHNLEIINKIKEFRMLGYPVMLGASRKSLIGGILDLPVEERLEGSIALSVCAVINGVDILRVHDVKETVRAIKVAREVIDGF
jgi:dihydropteroate synthase